MALKLAIDKINQVALKIEDKNEKEKRDMLLRCAGTALNSKLLSSYKDYFAELVV